MIRKTRLAGVGLVAGIGLATGALTVPSGSSGQTYTQPPTYTQPSTTTTTTTTVPVPVPVPPRDLTPAEENALIASMISALAEELGIDPQAVTLVRFGGGALVFARNLDVSRNDLRSDDGLQLGRFACFSAEGCETALNMKFRLGGRTFFNKKTAEMLDVGEQRGLNIKVVAAQARVLSRATRVRPAFALRVRDPRNNAITGNAKRQGRLDLP